MASSAHEKQLIGEIWTTGETYQNLEHLTDVLGSRWAGSESEHAAGEYLKSKLEEYGLTNVRLEPVPFGAWTRGHATFEITQPVQKSFSIIALPYSATGDLEAELVDAGNGEEEDFKRLGEAAKGKIAIIAAETNAAGTRGNLLSHRTDKLRFAVDAGVAGLIYINQNPGLLHITGSVGSGQGGPAAIIAVGTSWEQGQAVLRELRRQGSLTAKLSVGGGFNPDNVSYNVVGDIVGSQWPDELVLFGGHYDGHDISQGALDDGAGTVVALEAARVLAQLPKEAIGRTLRVVLFCGEEVGLYGSWGNAKAHEDAGETGKIRFVLNLDGAGRGKGGSETLMIHGRDELSPYFQQFTNESNYSMKLTNELNSHSDHYPYAIRGVPTATLNSPDDSSAMVGRGWGHTEGDTLDKANVRGLQMASMATARLLLKVAGDPDFPGTRRSKTEMQAQLEDLGLDIALKRRGTWSLVGGTDATE
jgi:Zn-dependent M28 family amino/carboxypeptidase